MSKQPLRCKKCGGFVERALTDIDGNPVYRCTSMLSKMNTDNIRTHMHPCGIIYDKYGKPIEVSELIPFMADGKSKYISALSLTL